MDNFKAGWDMAMQFLQGFFDLAMAVIGFLLPGVLIIVGIIVLVIAGALAFEFLKWALKSSFNLFKKF